MELSPAEKKRLGFFVLLGLSTLVISIVWLLDLHPGQSHTEYRAKFYDSISGLDIGAPVSYRGLKVGHVSHIYIDPSDSSAIEVIMQLQCPPLHKGTEATLDTSGLTGVKSVNLVPGDNKEPLLAAGSYLKTGPSFFDSLTNHAGSIIHDAKQVAQNIQAWTKDENRQKFETFLQTTASLTKNSDAFIQNNQQPLHAIILQLQQTSKHIDDAAQEASSTLRDLRQPFHQTQISLLQTLEAIRKPLEQIDPEDVGQLLHNMQQSSATINELLHDPKFQKGFHQFADTLSTVHELVKDVDMAVRAGRQDFILTLSYLKQAAEDLREFSRMLAENPSILVRGREESVEE